MPVATLDDSTEQSLCLASRQAKRRTKKVGDLSYMTRVQEVPRPFVGCTYCAYSVGAGKGPCPKIPRATLILQTVRGPRELCAAHAKSGTWNGSLFLPGDSQNVSTRPFSAREPQP